MGETDGVTVRPFEARDALRVAGILAVAFRDKLDRLVGCPRELVPELLVEAGPCYALPFPGNLVAELDGDVAGSMALKWRGQERPPRRRLKPRYGRSRWRDRAVVRFAQWVIDYRPPPGECYMEHIAVHPDAWGRGAGGALMERCDALALEQGLGRCSLFVASGNDRAVGLYERYGYRTERVVRSRLTELGVGVGEWHKMVKRLRV